jgi:hypothetical protein
MGFFVSLLYHYYMFWTGIDRSIRVMIIIIFGLIVFHAPLSVWLGSLIPEYDLVIKAWKELLMLCIAILLLLSLSYRGILRKVFGDRLIQLICAYTILHLITLVFLEGNQRQIIAGLMIDLRYIAFFALVYIATRFILLPRQHVLWVFAGSSGLSLLFAVLQITILPRDVLQYIGYNKDTIQPFLTVDRNENFIRINGTMRGPNPLGAVVMVWTMCVGVFAAMHRKFTHKKWWLFLSLYLMLGLTLWSTYSRSAVVGICVSVIVAVILWHNLRLPRSFYLVFTSFAVIAAFCFITLRDTHFFQAVIFHTDPSEGNTVNSDEGHADSLSDGMRRAFSQPFGAGIGSTGSASYFSDQPVIIENQYLLIAHEVGWLGILLFLIIFGVVLHRLALQSKKDWLAMAVASSGIGLAVIGIILPVFADDTVSIIWWGLAGLALGSYYQRNQHDKKAKTTS